MTGWDDEGISKDYLVNPSDFCPGSPGPDFELLVIFNASKHKSRSSRVGKPADFYSRVCLCTEVHRPRRTAVFAIEYLAQVQRTRQRAIILTSFH